MKPTVRVLLPLLCLANAIFAALAHNWIAVLGWGSATIAWALLAMHEREEELRRDALDRIAADFKASRCAS